MKLIQVNEMHSRMFLIKKGKQGAWRSCLYPCEECPVRFVCYTLPEYEMMYIDYSLAERIYDSQVMQDLDSQMTVLFKL